MSDAHLRDTAPSDAATASPVSHIPTSGPHPIPGGEYDPDGFLYRCRVENIRHERIRTELSSVLGAHMRRRHGPRALVAADVGLYARREDRFAKPLAPDVLVSLTAGDAGTPDTPPEADRMSYKLWQEPVPDVVLEIISPMCGDRDTRGKPSRYEAIGIPEYWVFDPRRRWVPNALHGRILVGETYRDAEPQVPDAARSWAGQDRRAPPAPLPDGTTAYWSAALKLYLYADGPDIACTTRATGVLARWGTSGPLAHRPRNGWPLPRRGQAALEAEVQRLRSR